MESRQPRQLPGSDRPLLTVLAVAVLALVLVHCVVGVFPVVYWDVNPRSAAGATAATALGPASAAWFNVLSVAVAAAALAGHVAAGGRINATAVVLTFLGMAACAWHGSEHIEDLRRGSAWMAAAALALAGFHLAQHERPRRYFAAALVAMLVPFVLQAITYVYVEFPATVRHFEQNEREIIEGRGWELGSPQHVLFVRRLRSPDALGSFGLSNVFGSVAGALTLLATALAVGNAKAGRWRHAWLPLLAAVGGLVTVLLTHSKGAAVALMAGLPLLAWAWWAPAWGRRRHVLPTAALLLVVLAIGAVLARGALGPPKTHTGERSILFRYHYWLGATRALAARPVRDVVLGTGIKGFHRAYQVHKSPLNPEAVTSAHNVFVDDVVMLGLGGLAWSCLLIWWLWRGGVAAGAAYALGPHASAGRGRAPPDQPNDRLEVRGTELLAAAVLAVALFGTQLAVEGRSLLTPVSFLVWSFGAIGFIAVFAFLATPGWVDAAALTVGLFAAAALALLHGQIEMTFFQEDAVMVVFFVVAVAAAPGAAVAATMGGAESVSEPQSTPIRRWLAPALLAVLALGMIAGYAVGLTRQQLALKAGASALRAGQVDDALAKLDDAIRLLPTDPSPYIWRAKLLVEAPGGDVEALHTLDAAERAGLGDLSLLQLRAQLFAYISDPPKLEQAVHAWQRVLEANPYGLQDHLQLADLYWHMNRHDDAGKIYRRCLLLDGQAYLDPAKQLTERQRDLAQARSGQ